MCRILSECKLTDAHMCWLRPYTTPAHSALAPSCLPFFFELYSSLHCTVLLCCVNRGLQYGEGIKAETRISQGGGGGYPHSGQFVFPDGWRHSSSDHDRGIEWLDLTWTWLDFIWLQMTLFDQSFFMIYSYCMMYDASIVVETGIELRVRHISNLLTLCYVRLCVLYAVTGKSSWTWTCSQSIHKVRYILIIRRCHHLVDTCMILINVVTLRCCGNYHLQLVDWLVCICIYICILFVFVFVETGRTWVLIPSKRCS